MPGEDPPRPPLPPFQGRPFEEQAALAELERLQKELEESRRRRRQAYDAFDSFIRSFGTRSPAPAPAESAAEPAPRHERRAEEQPAKAAGVPLGDVVRLSDFPSEELAAAAPVLAQPMSESALLEEIAAPAFESAVRSHKRSSWQPLTPSHHIPAALKPASRHRQRRAGLFALGGVALGGVAFLAWRATHSAPASDLAAVGPTSAKPAPVAPPVANTSAPPAPAPVPAAELTTSRRVWVRVLVDGERTIERELDANVRIPLSPKQRIVLRAGDAGAVRLLLAGKDQGVLGPDGIAVTRAFVIAPASR